MKKILMVMTTPIIVSFANLVLAQQYNIILMLSDDQSWSGLSMPMDTQNYEFENIFDETPNLEKLALEGTRFSRAYAPSPVCSPSRASIQTGKSPARLNWTKAAPFYRESDQRFLIPPTHDKNIDDTEITVGEMLREAGYNTAHLGKWHLLGGGPERHGYDVSDGNLGNKYAADYGDPNPVDLFGMIGRSKNFISDAITDRKPFFLQLSFHALHYPENALQKTIQKYTEKFGNQLQEREIQRLAINENMDSAIGQLLKYIENQQLNDTTYILYMADNGAFRRDSPLQGGKGSLWEGGIRVPFIIKGPDIPQNKTIDFPIVGYDLFPTFLNIAGVKENPKYLDGINILNLLYVESELFRRPGNGIIFHFPHYQKKQAPQSAIVSGKWKLIKNYEPTKNFLVDLSKDPSEATNLILNYPDIARTLLVDLETYLSEVNASLPSTNPSYDPTVTPKSTKSKKEKKNKKYKKNND